MKIGASDKTLESYRFFPYVAWIITISFALFVYNLTMEVKAQTDELHQRTLMLEQLVSTPPEQIEDFE
jgi:Tfp pilus assembly protein PilN